MSMKPGEHKTLIQRLAGLTKREAEFFLAANDKYLKKAYDEDRSLSPWDDHELSFLMERLVEEMQELIEAYRAGDMSGMKDECLDVTNFARFIYEKANKEITK